MPHIIRGRKLKTKADIVKNWIKRYTGTSSDGFGDWILLTNFQNYVDKFAERFDVNAMSHIGNEGEQIKHFKY